MDDEDTQITETWLNLKSVERFFIVNFQKEFRNIDRDLNIFKLSACHYMRSFLDIFHENIFDIYLKYFNSEIDLDTKVDEFSEEVYNALDIEGVFFALNHFRDNLKIYHNRAVLEVRSEIEAIIDRNLIPLYFQISSNDS